jgi:prophage tail gpP-like protein
MELYVDGRQVGGFTDGEVTQSLDAFASSFRIGYGDDTLEGEESLVIEAGDPVQVRIGDDVLTDGYVVDDEDGYGTTQLRRTIRGASRLVDLVDSSAYTGRTRRWRDATLQNIVGDLLEGFDVDFRVDVDVSPAFRRFSFHESEKISQVLKRVAAARGALIVDEAGTLVMERAGARASQTILGFGSVLNGRRMRSWRARYSRYRFKGRTAATDDLNGLEASEIGQEIEDQGVSRNRLLIISNFGDRSEDLGKRAVVERNRRAGRSERLIYRVAGWKDEAGIIWRPNTRVRVVDERLAVNATLLTTRTTAFFRDNTKRTEIELVRPEAFDTLVSYPTRARGSEVTDR